MTLTVIPHELTNGQAGSLFLGKYSLKELDSHDELLLYLSNTNVRIGSATVSIEPDHEKNLWIVKQRLEITENESHQTISSSTTIDGHLKTHSYKEELFIKNFPIYSLTVTLDPNSNIYTLCEKRDDNTFSEESFKSQHSYPILFPGSLYLFQSALLKSPEVSGSPVKSFDFLIFDRKIVKKAQIQSRKISSYFGITLRIKSLDGSQSTLAKETLFSINSKSLANDRLFGDNFELRSNQYAEEWNETNVYSNILEDVELSSYFKRNKGTLSNHLKKYIEENGALQDILSDYLKLLLHHKPQNVFQFTVNFFNPSKAATRTRTSD